MEFKELMRAGQADHVSWKSGSAVGILLSAREVADNDLDRGRADRDIAASLSATDNLGDADFYATRAAGLHLQLLQIPSPENVEPPEEQERQLRQWRLQQNIVTPELGASQDRVSRIAARIAIKAALSGARIPGEEKRSLESSRSAIKHIERIEELRAMPYQYGINMRASASMIEALFGNFSTALRLGRKATLLSVLSERPTLTDGASLTMSGKERFRARGFGLIKGVATVPVGAMSRFRLTRSSALRLADKFM